MQAVILAGGLGTRISEETTGKPKPMIEIGGMPILWHIMKIYSFNGVNDFIICCGYKGYLIKEYFANYYLHNSDVTFDMKDNRMTVHKEHSEDWRITLIDTGEGTMTGGRILRIKNYISDENFFLTYGDGVSDVNIKKSFDFHNSNSAIVTLTSVFPPGRFGSLNINSEKRVENFEEKPKGDGAQINGGFFVVNTKAFDYLVDDNTIWEHEPLTNIALKKGLYAYQHNGFWQPMDTLRDKNYLESLWSSDNAPWKKW